MTANSLTKTITLSDTFHMLHQAWTAGLASNRRQLSTVSRRRALCFMLMKRLVAIRTILRHVVGGLDDVELPESITMNEFQEFVAVDCTAPMP